MMKRNSIKKEVLHTIDLTAIEGDGSFPCPNCGTVLSPDDESEEIYSIVETKILHGELVELVLSCNNCKTAVRLTGFVSTI